MRRILVPLLAVLLAAPLLSGCESTFDKAAKARAAAGTIEQPEAATITQAAGVSAEVESVLPSADGTTAAVVVRITTDEGVALVWPKIQIEVLDASGAVIGTNNIAGALPELIHVPSVPAGATSTYVNDQILISGTPASARVAIEGAPLAGPLPQGLEATPPQVVADPSLGDSWTSTITNGTGIRQEVVLVEVVVRKQGKVVGAGTAMVQGGLEPGASADVTGYLFGSSDGDLEILVPPSNAADGAGAPAAGGSTTAPSPTASDTGVTAPEATLQIG